MRKDFFVNFFLINSLLQEKTILDCILSSSKCITLPYNQIYSRNGKRCLLMPFYSQSIALSEINAMNENLLLRIRKLIVNLHKIDWKNGENGEKNNRIIKRWKWSNFLEKMAYLSKNIRSKKIRKLHGSVLKFVFSYEKSNYSLVLSHNDLVPGNILWFKEKNQFFLIDWEYGSLNNRLFDIASFASETLVGKWKKWRSYWFSLFSLSSREKKNLFQWMRYHDLFWFYWANYFFVLSKRKDKRLDDIRKKKYRACVSYKEAGK